MTSQKQLEFLLPDEVSLDEVVSRLHAGNSFSKEGISMVTSTFLDSFDWRLHAGGITLLEQIIDGRRSLLQHGIPDLRTKQVSLFTAKTPLSEFTNRF